MQVLVNWRREGPAVRIALGEPRVVDAAGAQLNNPGGYTLNLNQAHVRGSVRLIGDFESIGVVVVNRATIEGRFQCSMGSFNCPAPSERNENGHAIEAISATIRGGMDLGWKSVSPSVDLTNAATPFLADNPMRWPPRFVVSGFTYDRFEKPQGSGPGGTWEWWLNTATVLGWLVSSIFVLSLASLARSL